jgi:hypothetical protein
LPVAGHDTDQADFRAHAARKTDDVVDMGPDAIAAVNGHKDPFLTVGVATRSAADVDQFEGIGRAAERHRLRPYL